MIYFELLQKHFMFVIVLIWIDFLKYGKTDICENRLSAQNVTEQQVCDRSERIGNAITIYSNGVSKNITQCSCEVVLISSNTTVAVNYYTNRGQNDCGLRVVLGHTNFSCDSRGPLNISNDSPSIDVGFTRFINSNKYMCLEVTSASPMTVQCMTEETKETKTEETTDNEIQNSLRTSSRETSVTSLGSFKTSSPMSTKTHSSFITVPVTTSDTSDTAIYVGIFVCLIGFLIVTATILFFRFRRTRARNNLMVKQQASNGAERNRGDRYTEEAAVVTDNVVYNIEIPEDYLSDHQHHANTETPCTRDRNDLLITDNVMYNVGLQEETTEPYYAIPNKTKRENPGQKLEERNTTIYSKINNDDDVGT